MTHTLTRQLRRKGKGRSAVMRYAHHMTVRLARARTQCIGPDDGGNGWPVEHVKTRGEGSLVYDIQETARSSKRATRSSQQAVENRGDTLFIRAVLSIRN